MVFAFGQRIDLEKAANDSGFEIITYKSDGSKAELSGADSALRVRVSPVGGGYCVTLDDSAVATTLAGEGAFARQANGVFEVDTAAHLGSLLLRAWRLSRALPEAPLARFKAAEIAPEDSAFRTEVERLVRQRRGQEIFRQALFDYWEGRCAVTGLDQPELLRAGHIKPWTDCANDAERLDVFNGFLLTADWDAAFDTGLVTFDRQGSAVFSDLLLPVARARLGIGRLRRPLASGHRGYLDWHLTQVFKH